MCLRTDVYVHVVGQMHIQYIIFIPRWFPDGGFSSLGTPLQMLGVPSENSEQGAPLF